MFFFFFISNSISYVLNRLNFLLSTIAARANRCAYRNGNTAVPDGRGEMKGRGGGKRRGPATLPNRYGVTFCLFTFDYTIWHTFTRRGESRRSVVTALLSLTFQTLCSSVLFPLKKKKKENVFPSSLVSLIQFKIRVTYATKYIGAIFSCVTKRLI